MPECIGKTMIELAKAWKPTTTLVWIGNNDALIAGLFGDVRLLTPESKFQADFAKLMRELASTGTELVVGTIPDVTQIPYFSSAADIAEQYHLSPQALRTQLGLQPGDFVRRSALPIIDSIVRKTTKGPLPAMCPPPIYVLPETPCRLTKSEADIIQDRVKAFNKIIAKETHTRGGVLVDTNKLVDKIAKKGYVVGNERLSAAFLGGLFSLDGIHPSDTGYAVIANYFIDRMNPRLGLRIPKVSVEAVWAKDPLRPFAHVDHRRASDNNDHLVDDEN
jgi:lysophospholipase L1-like esterase